MWSFDNPSDRDVLCKIAVSSAVNSIMQNNGLMFREFDDREFAQSTEFLGKCKKGFDEELDRCIESMKQKGEE